MQNKRSQLGVLSGVIKQFVPITVFVVACGAVGTAWGLGGVIRVGVTGDRLTVAGGVTENAGFADRMFAETDADGFPTSTSVSGFGPSYLWTVPGVRLEGLTDNSGLYIEALARPVKNASPEKDRVLWYWDPADGAIKDVPDDNHFLIYKGFASQSIFLSGTTSTTPDALKLAAPVSSDLGFDSYGGFLRLALHRQVPPPTGAYGFFARFTSDVYQPSDPFLVVFNQGQLSAAQVTAGALAINAAAVAESTLPGDFDGDGRVDAADYTVWRNGLGSIYTPADYLEWKNNFGATQGADSGALVANVPEPAGILLSIVAVVGALVLGSRPAHLSRRHRFNWSSASCRLR